MIVDYGCEGISLINLSNCRFANEYVLPIQHSVEQDLRAGRDLLVVRDVSVKMIVAPFSKIVQIWAAQLGLADQMELFLQIRTT